MPVGLSEVSAAARAGARVACAGVGMPEARGLCRVSLNGHADESPGESGG